VGLNPVGWSPATGQFVFETVQDHLEDELEAVLGCGGETDIRLQSRTEAGELHAQSPFAFAIASRNRSSALFTLTDEPPR
jgi:hypothetical protein